MSQDTPSLGLPPVPPLWTKDLPAAAGHELSWLWQGYLAPGLVTLLASQWKSGKTTLLSVILERLHSGRPLAGLPVCPGKALVVSEESPAMWLLRGRKFHFGDNVCWLCRPFRGKPAESDWKRLIAQIADLHREFGFDLAVFDPLAAVLPGRDENSAGPMLNALGELSALTSRGLAVLLIHHTRKDAASEGQAARGSGALPGFVDILIEMHWYSRASDSDRRRKLLAWSRFDETPRRMVIELTDDGTDYAALGDIDVEEYAHNWRTLEAVLKLATHRLTRIQVQEEWPEGEPKPDGTSLWRWLTRAVDEGRLCRSGAGRKSDPHRYWLPGKLEQWQADPWHIESMPPLPPLDSLLPPWLPAAEPEPEREFTLEELLGEKARRAAEKAK